MLAPKEQREHQHRGREHRGRGAPPHFHEGTLLLEKFRIERMIGGGGFGQIYKAYYERTRQLYAIKVEPNDHEPGRIILEQKVLLALNAAPHIPELIASGSFNKYNFIVMEMLGKNLNDIRKKQKKRRLSLGTVSRVGRQCIYALRTIHDIGYIHRDVKPSNICIGRYKKKRTIYLIDFGMTRKFRFENGIVRKERWYAGFRGTMRYVSVTVHERKEQGPVDDLWSLFYSLVELLEGFLPWREIANPDDIAVMKKNISFKELGRFLPIEMKDFVTHIEDLQYNQIPEYDLLLSILKKCQPLNVGDDTPYEWEEVISKTYPEVVVG